MQSRANALSKILLPASLSLLLPLLIPVCRNLEYEYALFSANIAILTFPFLAFSNRFFSLPDFHRYRITFLFGSIVILPLILLIIGWTVFALNICMCSQNGFYFWLAALWYPSWVFALSCFSLLKLLQKRVAKPKLVLIWVSILLIGYLHASQILWINPQKRISHLFLGFIHGPIYDNWIPLDLSILLSRLGHLVVGVTLITLSFWRRSNWYFLLLAAQCLFILANLFYLSTTPSTANKQATLEALLPYKVIEDDFTLHANAPSTEVSSLATQAKYHIQSLKIHLKQGSYDHVYIFLYPSKDEKKLWFGGGATDVADVYTPSIHITDSSWPHPTLRHELVHALASKQAFHGLGFHPNMALTEGLAVALAPEKRQRTLHQDSGSLIGSGRIPNVEELLSPFFWKYSGGRAYTVAGSLILYLSDSYGIEPILSLYQGKNWNASGDKVSMTQVLQEWKSFVSSLHDKEKDDLLGEALYRYPGVLADICPHSKADLRKDHRHLSSLRQPLNWLPNRDYWPWRLRLDPSDKYAAMKLTSLEVQSWIHKAEQEKLAQFAAKYSELLDKGPSSIEDIEQLILMSDVLVYLEKLEEATQLRESITNLTLKKSVPDYLNRAIQARRLISQQSQNPRSWILYLAGWSSLPATTPLKKIPWIEKYLIIRKIGFSSENPTKVYLQYFPEEELPSQLRTEWFRLMGSLAAKNQHFELAQSALKEAAKSAPSGSLAYYNLLEKLAAFHHRESIPL